MNGKRGGKSRMPAPPLRDDAWIAQQRKQQGRHEMAKMMATQPRRRANTMPTMAPVEAPPRRAQEVQPVPVAGPSAERQTAAASAIQRAFRAHRTRKGVKAASADLQESMKGNTPAKLMKMVGDEYVKAGLVRTTASPVTKASGRLAGDWSGGVDTQKRHLEANRTADPSSTLDPIGTTHHTVSDHFLGFVDEGVKRLENGTVSEKAAASAFRSRVASDSLYAPQGVAATSAEQATRHEKALFQVRQNLTYGPGSDFIKGDPGVGFDATFTATGHKDLPRDWDARSARMRPIHNLGLLMKSGGYELTEQGAQHMTTQLAEARTSHDAALSGMTYDVTEKRMAKGGVEVSTVVSHPQTIPVHGEKSGHFVSTPITRKKSSATVSGFQKKKWK